MANRRFVNMMVHDYESSIYSLCRINLSQHLFHPSTAAAAAQQAVKAKTKKNKQGWPSTISRCKRLPWPVMNFQSPPDVANACSMHFFSLLRGQGESCLMFADPNGNTVFYDDDMKALVGMPRTNFRKPSDSISLSMTQMNRGCLEDQHSLYVMGDRYGFFEVFHYSKVGVSNYPAPFPIRWSWHPLPPLPPIVHKPGFGCDVCPPSAAAVVDDTTICASMLGGTYKFDTVRNVWRQAGSWVLPFHGRAEFAPEIGLWFGLEAAGSPHHRLCAFDLSASTEPAVQNAWDYLDDLPEEWLPFQRSLVNLGSGRFCIGTFCRRMKRRTTTCTSGYSDDEDPYMINEELVVLTAVEVVRCDDGLLQMIRHKSMRYSFPNLRFQCVL